MLVEACLIEAQDDRCGCIALDDHESGRRSSTRTTRHLRSQPQSQPPPIKPESALPLPNVLDSDQAFASFKAAIDPTPVKLFGMRAHDHRVVIRAPNCRHA